MTNEEYKKLESTLEDCLDTLQTCMNRFKYVEARLRSLQPKEELAKTIVGTITPLGIANEPKPTKTTGIPKGNTDLSETQKAELRRMLAQVTEKK